MKHLKLIIFLFIFFPVLILNAQYLPGKLLLVGGGSEKINGWSDAPYGWAVDQSGNKRVAIITYDPDASSWLPNYFMNLGAVEAKNFIIPNESTANLQEIYDSLITYDVIFFKGGDQWKYYDYYKNTLLHQAVEMVYLNGGVIGGTSAGLAILSGVIFTAENGTVYPEEALADPFNQYMTLEDDFLNLFPGYIFDSHFVERARFGRLLGFLGHWDIAHDEEIKGIGVDDKTAFCIDSDNIGKVYGTGAVTIMQATENTNFRLSGDKLLGSQIKVRQLLHECTINLETHEISGLNTPAEPINSSFTFFNHLWISGSDKLYNNVKMLQEFVETIPVSDTILIVTGANTSAANIFGDYMEENLSSDVLILQAIPATLNDPLWTDRINRLSKFLIIGNEYDTFMDYLHSWPNGTLLKDKVLSGEKQIAFVGDNSRFAGKTVLVNYEQEYASYDGLLEFDEGWVILRNTIIMPKAFSEDIDNENAAAGVPYGMLLDNLYLGIWLYDDCYMHYHNGLNISTIRSHGSFPMILIRNNATVGDFSTQSAVSSGEPRDVAGFDLFKISLMDSTTAMDLPLTLAISEIHDTPFQISPNPARNTLTISSISGGESVSISLFDLKGNKVIESNKLLPCRLSVGHLSKGIYFIRVMDEKGTKVLQSKVILQ